MYFSEPLSLLQAMILLQPDCSKTRLRQFISQGRALVDGKPVTQAAAIVQPGQEVQLSDRKLKYTDDLVIVYEDPSFIVIDKPAGLLSVASNFEKQQTAHGFVKKHCYPKKIFVIHRLDLETSGLMVFAKTEQAYTVLKEQLAERSMKRVYYGVVSGELTGSGSWRCYLREDAAYLMHASDEPTPGAELACTHYEVVRHSARYSLVRFTLDTGKKNQIRVQASRAGHPLMGDSKYGKESYVLGRLALHAAELSFSHPVTKKRLSFSAPYPSQFESLFFDS